MSCIPKYFNELPPEQTTYQNPAEKDKISSSHYNLASLMIIGLSTTFFCLLAGNWIMLVGGREVCSKASNKRSKNGAQSTHLEEKYRVVLGYSKIRGLVSKKALDFSQRFIGNCHLTAHFGQFWYESFSSTFT